MYIIVDNPPLNRIYSPIFPLNPILCWIVMSARFQADILKSERQNDSTEKKIDVSPSPIPSTLMETKPQFIPHPPSPASTNTLNIPGALVDATSTSRSPTMRHSRSARIGLGQSKPRHSLSLVFSSSSILMLPCSQNLVHLLIILMNH